MTDEVGVVTGELELRSNRSDDTSGTVEVRYAGAVEWYTVTGTNGLRLHDARDHEPVHATLVAQLNGPE
jgi:hypothetical protein